MRDPVVMYHQDRPTDTTTVEREAYRYEWYPKGWRSDDDPGFVGTDNSILEAVKRHPGFGAQWAKARSETPARRLMAHWWGDSIAVGDDASSNDAAGAAANTFAQKDAWRNLGMVGVFNSRMQAQFGDGGSGFSPFGLAVTTGTWTSGVGFGTCEFRATAAASAEFHVRGDLVRIYHRNANMTAGSFRYQVDGGAFTTVTPPTGFGVDPGYAEAPGLSTGEHTVRIEWVSGTVGINGVEGLVTTGTGFRTHRCAQHGLAANQLSDHPLTRRTVTCATTSGNNTLTASVATFTQADVGAKVVGTGIPGLGAVIQSVTSATVAVLDQNASSTQAATPLTFSTTLYPFTPGVVGSALDRKITVAQTINPSFSVGLGLPDIVVLALNVNDPSNSRHSVSGLVDAYSYIARKYTALADADNARTPEFVVVIHHIGKWFDTDAIYPKYVAACYDFAQAVDGAVVDMWNAGKRSYKFMQDRKYWAGAAWDNVVHPSKSGHARVGHAVANLFL